MAKTREEKRAYNKAWYAKNRERVSAELRAYKRENKAQHNEDQRKYYQENKDKYKVYAQKQRAKAGPWRKKNYEENRERFRARGLLNRFNLTTEQFNTLLSKQENRCAVCSRHFETEMLALGNNKKSNRPHVDHDHASGKVRGLLCSQCNTAIGLLSDNVATVLNAACYLENPPNGS